MKPRVAIREKPHRFQLSPLRDVPAAQSAVARSHNLPTRHAFKDKTNIASRTPFGNRTVTEHSDLKASIGKPLTRPQSVQTTASSASKIQNSTIKAKAGSRKLSFSQINNVHGRSKTSPAAPIPALTNSKFPQSPSAEKSRLMLSTHKPTSNKVRDSVSVFSSSAHTPSVSKPNIRISSHQIASVSCDAQGILSASKSKARGSFAIDSVPTTSINTPSASASAKLTASRRTTGSQQRRLADRTADTSVDSNHAAFGSPLNALRRYGEVEQTPQPVLSRRFTHTPNVVRHTWKAVSVDTPTKVASPSSRVPHSRNLSLESALHMSMALDDSTVTRAFELGTESEGDDTEPSSAQQGTRLQEWTADVRATAPLLQSHASDSTLNLLIKSGSTSFSAGGAVVDEFLARLKNGVEGKLQRLGTKLETSKGKPGQAQPPAVAFVDSVSAAFGDDARTRNSLRPVSSAQHDHRHSLKRRAIYSHSLHMPNFRGIREGERYEDVLRENSRAGARPSTTDNPADSSLLLEPFPFASALESQTSISSMYSQTSIAGSVLHASTPLGTHRSSYSLDSFTAANIPQLTSGKISTAMSTAGSLDSLARLSRPLDAAELSMHPSSSLSSAVYGLGDKEIDDTLMASASTTVNGRSSTISQMVDYLAPGLPPLSIAVVPPSDSLHDFFFGGTCSALLEASVLLKPDSRYPSTPTTRATAKGLANLQTPAASDADTTLDGHPALETTVTPRPLMSPSMSSLNVQSKFRPAQAALKLGAKLAYHPIIAELLEEVDRDIMSWMRMQVDATICGFGM